MSVAFRREGDDEHLEPKFEIPIPPGPNRVTARGLAQIGARVAALGDMIVGLTEEAAITAGIFDEAALNAARRELRYWQTRQITAELMPVADGQSAQFGTVVELLLKGMPRCVTIVGDDEAEPAAGLLAFASPLARALIGGEVGERLPFGGEEDAIEIISIKALA